MKYIVYALVDPRNDEIRYVGRSCKGLRRARASAKEEFAHKGNWIKQLKRLNLSPKIKVLEECESKEHVIDRETYWIKSLRESARLTNITDGGNDQNPFPSGKDNPIHNPNVLEKALASRKRSFDRQKHSDLAKKRWQRFEYRRAVTTANRQRNSDPKRRREVSDHFRRYFRKNGTYNQRPVYAIMPSGGLLFFRSLADASRELNIQTSNLCKVLKGQRNTAGGYRFEYGDSNVCH